MLTQQLNKLEKVNYEGFRYFSMYLRGREELLIKVLNDQVPLQPTHLTFDTAMLEEENLKDDEDDAENSLTDKADLPRAFESLCLSKSTQRSLSGFHFLDIGLPPASPCEGDLHIAENHTTMFLIGAYSRYCCPYVWVRSNHNRLIRFTDNHQSFDDIYHIKDSPLKLKTTTDWLHKDLQIWDILAEIVRINVQPSPRNPFAIDYSYFDELNVYDRILESGGMIHFLQRVLLDGNHSYHAQVSKELEDLMKRHFKAVKTLSVQQ